MNRKNEHSEWWAGEPVKSRLQKMIQSLMQVRPFLSQFLQVAANMFELVVFTARWATHLFSDKL